VLYTRIMLCTKKETLEEQIVRLLLTRERTAKTLLAKVQEQSESYTIQALYVVLRNLIDLEVIVKRGTLYFINEEWKIKIADQLKAQEGLVLSEGESVSYILGSLVHHDLQWKNIVLPLHEAHPHDPIFFYNFHYIWHHLGETRARSEESYYDLFTKQKKYAFSLIGSNSIHDIQTKKQFQNEYVQWAVGAAHISQTDYLAVFSDYIITTRFSKRLVDEIGHCYLTSSDTGTLEHRLQKIGIEKKKVRLIIERDRDKAKKLRKKLSKEFFVPQELIKEFDLY